MQDERKSKLRILFKEYNWKIKTKIALKIVLVKKYR